MNNRRRGKDLERFLAKDLKGRRLGLLGMEDVILGDDYAIECKEREKLPVFLRKCMAQACANCNNKTPIVVLHQLGDHHADDLVIMRYSDWKLLIANSESAKRS